MKRTSSRLMRLATFLLLLVPLLIACSGSLGSGSGSVGDESDESLPDVDQYVHMTFGAPNTLDPAQAYDTSSGAILENIYETLYTYKGQSITEFEPVLATGYSISDDGKTYTFDLREGVKFHSGNTMTCRDVEYSIERLLVTNPMDSASWFYADSLIGYDGLNARDYFGEDASQEDLDEYWAAIDNSVECIDDHTVAFHLIKNDPAFFVKLMYTASSIVDSQYAIENGEWSGTEADWYDWAGVSLRGGFLHSHDAGTGAYRLVKWDDSEVAAERFADYWGERPQVINIKIVNEPDQDARIEALRSGAADRITASADALDQIAAMPNARILRSDDWVSAGASAVMFNENIAVEDNPLAGSGQLDGNGVPADFFADVNVRKAFAYSFDQEAIINDLYGGDAVPLTMALPPSFLGYDPDLPIYDYDAAKAEEYFRKAYDGALWDTGFSMTIAYNSGNIARQMVAEVLKRNIEDLNPKFKIEVLSMPWADFLTAYKNGQLPALVLGWGADYADPDNFIYVFYHSNGYYARKIAYSNPAMDALIDEARSITDPDERAELYSRVGQLAYDDAPLIPLPSPTGYMTLAKHVYTKNAPEGMDVYNNPLLSGSYRWKDILIK